MGAWLRRTLTTLLELVLAALAGMDPLATGAIMVARNSGGVDVSTGSQWPPS
jgi:hypothetical protein